MKAQLGNQGIPELSFDHTQDVDQELISAAVWGLHWHEAEQRKVVQFLPASTELYHYDQFSLRVDNINEPVLISGEEALDLCVKGWATAAKMDLVRGVMGHRTTLEAKKEATERASLVLSAIEQALLLKDAG